MLEIVFNMIVDVSRFRICVKNLIGNSVWHETLLQLLQSGPRSDLDAMSKFHSEIRKLVLILVLITSIFIDRLTFT